MPSRPGNLDQLFDRAWRPGHPFRPRLSPLRRRAAVFFLALLVGIITAYAYLTNSRRVRQICEAYLSQKFGATVTVKHAALSIFEGLRLDGVTVSLPGDHSPDARIFDAQAFVLKYNLRSMFSGNLEVTQILAIEPRMHLCERLDDAAGPRWNYSRMILPASTTRAAGLWPTITLRNGIVQYSQMLGGHIIPVGSMALDGSVTPSEEPGEEKYVVFHFQSRGQESQALGPELSGKRNLETGEIKSISLENFQFNSDVKSMLPQPIAQWWDQHRLSGRFDIVDMDLFPGPDAASTRFRVETQMTDVNLVFAPRQWWSPQQIDRLDTLHGAFDLMGCAGLDSPIPGPAHAPGMVAWIAALAEPSPIHLDKVSGKLVFTQDGIKLQNVQGRIEHNSFNIDGHIDGYTPSVPFDLTVRAADFNIPHTPRYLNALPREVHEFWQHLHPEGAGTLQVHLSRHLPGAWPDVEGRIDILDGRFEFDLFRYPLRKITGAITFGPDPANPGTSRCDITGLRGQGAEGGPNAANIITMDGYVAPLNPDGRVHLELKSSSVYLEKAINDAFPPEVQTAMRMFDAGGTRGFPDAHGALQIVVQRPPGPDKDMIFSVIIDVDDGTGTFSLFPYRLDHVQAKISVLPDGRLEIANAHAQQGQAAIAVNGVVLFGNDRPLEPHLQLTAHDLPIDRRLLDALPPEKRQWLARLGLSGKLDIAGNIFRAASVARRPSAAKADDSIDFDLQMALRDAAIAPPDSKFSLSLISSQLRLSSQRLAFSGLHARRGQAELTADGSMDWSDNLPVLQIAAAARNLGLDAPLHDLLPAPARNAWDQLQPTGSIDAELTYRGTSPAAPSTAPSSAPSVPSSFVLKLNPRELSANCKFLPYALSDIHGAAIVEPAKVTLKDFSARHGNATLSFSGTGALDAPVGAQNWELHLVGKDLAVNDEFKRAMPPALGKLLGMLEASGTIGFDFSHLSFAAARASPAPTTLPAAATLPAAPGPADTDMDIAGELHLRDGALNVSVPLGSVNGAIGLYAKIRASKLAEFKGNVKIDSMTIADRPAKNFVATLDKPADRQALKIDRMGGAFAGGEMSGQVDLAFPDVGKSHYAMAFALRNVDVKELARVEEPVKGQLNASLSLEGVWGESATRRGRGDVDLSGKDMYKIPLVLGLMQITNLSLPLTSPFSQATTRYSVEGPLVTFENINLRSGNMAMSGSGSMNFETRKVKMTFTTDNPDWPKLPLVNGLLQGAKNELLQIHVNGTIQEPKVSARTMNTFTTTVDQVLRGGESSPSDDSNSAGSGGDSGGGGRRH